MPPPELKTQHSQPNIHIVPPSASGDSARHQRTPSRPLAPDEQAPVRRTRSQIEIQKFAEGEDDEDFSDILGPNGALVEKEDSDRGSEDGTGGMMLLSKLSNSSWLGDDEDEDDPFAMMDPEYNEMDLEANIARDRHARLAERVEELVQLLKVGTEITGEERVSDVAEELVYLLHEHEDVKGLIIGAHGLLPILELLTLPPDTISTAKGRQDMILLLLKVVNKVSLSMQSLAFLDHLLTVTRSFFVTGSCRRICASLVVFQSSRSLLRGNSRMRSASKLLISSSRCTKRQPSRCRCLSAVAASRSLLVSWTRTTTCPGIWSSSALMASGECLSFRDLRPETTSAGSFQKQKCLIHWLRFFIGCWMRTKKTSCLNLLRGGSSTSSTCSPRRTTRSRS